MGLFKRAVGRLAPVQPTDKQQLVSEPHTPHRDTSGQETPAPERKGRWWLTDEDRDKSSSPSTQMAVALAATGKQFYEGTVDPAVKARRRVVNRRARAARRVQRAHR